MYFNSIFYIKSRVKLHFIYKGFLIKIIIKMAPIIELKNISKIYKTGEVEFVALDNINLKIESGDFVAIVGQSGSGKSTMMNIIGCLDTPTKGHVFFNKQDLSKFDENELADFRGRRVGFIFQQYNLINKMTAFENVLLPMDFLEFDEDYSKTRAEMSLKLVGLYDKRNNKPTQLSGGQQQRISIARCLVANPDVILADEPTGALDSKTGANVLEILKKLNKEEKKTIIMITHDLKLAQHANTIIELSDGKIIKNNNK